VQRRTRQRDAIVSALKQAARPLAPLEILEQARGLVPRLGIATVYRAMRELLEEGIAIGVELPGESLRYELSGHGHHHHFQCRDCGKVFEVHGCPPGLSKLTPKGFRLDSHEVVLYGACSFCLNTAA
jgi:Fur family ferric uptake transcriptional regulator